MQDLKAQIDRAFFSPVAIHHETLRENFGEDPFVHSEFRQSKFKLVHVTVVANLFCAGNGFESRREVSFDEGRRVGVPPVTVGDDIGENPGVAGQFLIGHAGQYRDREHHFGKRVEQVLILDQRDATVVEVLTLENPLWVHRSVDTNHQIEGKFELSAKLGELPEDSEAHGFLVYLLSLFPALLKLGDGSIDSSLRNLFGSKRGRQRNRARSRVFWVK